MEVWLKPARSDETMDTELVRRIEELRCLSIPKLKEMYRQVCGKETRCLHKQYLFRRIAWQLQAQAQGGLSENVQRRAFQIADNADLRLGGKKGFWTWSEKPILAAPPNHRDGRLPSPGAVIKKRYEGREIIVKVLDRGFEYQSRHYRSLSAIARDITGTRWNGLLFFGLTNRRHG
jgi:hypothetical protein